ALDGAAHAGEQLAHALDVGDRRHVAQDVLAGSEQRRREELQHRVLGAGHPDPPRQGAAGAHADGVHLSEYRARAGGAVSSPPAVPVVVAVHPAEAGATVRSPRDDAIVRERPIGEGRFACDEGPFAAYERTVRTLDDGRVEERVRYRLAIGAWSALFELPLRRALRIRPARTPWWAPP